ncbi:uncharacterized protein LOC114915531 [Cajanus cajan]|uniref:uncharacterized protein LOC114915531 n=1 Tax=Cajanus cajan TaxID=3821 RepID=UPI0010FBAEB3|nr:uncharacterized protein LOC114915531 [Cajanus cajan]
MTNSTYVGHDSDLCRDDSAALVLKFVALASILLAGMASILLQVPILCFALLSLGVVLSPANPLSTCSELTRLLHLRRERTHHVLGFMFCLRAMTLTETVVVMERFSMRGMLGAVERFGVTHLTVVPSVVVVVTKDGITDGYSLKSLESVVR